MYFHHLLLLILCCDVVFARRNVTVDDQDSSIQYLPPGAWFRSANSLLDLGGAHMLTQNGNATATFNFTGVAIYFLSPLWPYLVNTAVSLDSGPAILVDLVDHSRPNTGSFGSETVQSQVVWSATGLNNTQHSLVMSIGARQPFAVVDGLIYTILEPSDSTSGTPTPTSLSSLTTLGGSPSSALPSPASTTQKRTLPIALGSILGTLGILLIALLVWCCIRRRRRPVSEAWTVAALSKSGSSPTSGPSSGPSPISLGPPAMYPMTQNSAFPLSYNQTAMTPQFDQATWQNPRYGYVGLPAPVMTPPTFPTQPYAANYGPFQDPSANMSSYQEVEEEADASCSPGRYVHGVTLSTITENSPSIAEGRVTLANSPASDPSELASSTVNENSEGVSSAGSESPRPDFPRHQRDGLRNTPKHSFGGHPLPQYSTDFQYYQPQRYIMK